MNTEHYYLQQLNKKKKVTNRPHSLASWPRLLGAWDEERAEEPVEIGEVQEEGGEQGRSAAAPWAAVQALEEAEGAGPKEQEDSWVAPFPRCADTAPSDAPRGAASDGAAKSCRSSTAWPPRPRSTRSQRNRQERCRCPVTSPWQFGGTFSPAESLLAELAENPSKSTQQSGSGQPMNSPRLSSPHSPWTKYHVWETIIIILSRNLLSVFPAVLSVSLPIKKLQKSRLKCTTEGGLLMFHHFFWLSNHLKIFSLVSEGFTLY